MCGAARLDEEVNSDHRLHHANSEKAVATGHQRTREAEEYEVHHHSGAECSLLVAVRHRSEAPVSNLGRTRCEVDHVGVSVRGTLNRHRSTRLRRYSTHRHSDVETEGAAPGLVEGEELAGCYP